MQRTTATGTVTSLPTPASPVTSPGYYAASGATQQTYLSNDSMNSIQEEIVSVIASASIALNVATNNQLLAAIQAVTAHGEANFNTSGTSTWTVPTGIDQAHFELWGATGGSGGSSSAGAGSGAGGGGYCSKWISVTAGTVYTMTLSGGGTAGATGTNGGAASASTITGTGLSLTANPGAPGQGGNSGVGGAASGGTATGGDVNQTGGSSNNGIINGTLYIGGVGGCSFRGGSITSYTIGTAQGGNLPGGGPGGGANAQNGIVGSIAWAKITW